MAGNTLTGPLPDTWGATGAFASLTSLQLGGNQLSGPLPHSWGHNGSLTALAELHLANNSLSGALPPAWGTPGRFSHLVTLELQGNQLSGEQPASPPFPRAAHRALVSLRAQCLRAIAPLSGRWPVLQRCLFPPQPQ